MVMSNEQERTPFSAADIFATLGDQNTKRVSAALRLLYDAVTVKHLGLSDDELAKLDPIERQDEMPGIEHMACLLAHMAALHMLAFECKKMSSNGDVKWQLTLSTD